MTGGGRILLVSAFAVLLALAGCGRSMLTQGERPAWRHQAEARCLQSGELKLGGGIVQIEPIEGPGLCGADFPLKVAALGEGSTRLGYNDIPRPPASIGNAAQMPNWPPSEARYARPMPVQPAQPVQGEQLRWTPGAPAAGAPQIDAPEVTAPQYGAPQYTTPQYNAPRYDTPRYETPRYNPPAAQPMSIHPQNAMPSRRDDIPDDAVLPDRRNAPQRMQPAYNAPVYAPPQQQPRYTPPALGPLRGPASTGTIPPAAVKPAATLSCPIVSALDRWVRDGVQPAALHWFGVPVTEIKQISAYSCRSMVGAGTRRISEHAFGNALDIAGFTLADGRKITVKNGWRGTPEEQGFLHDVQLYACETFVTVLAPGYNAAHYDHFHVDLQRRKNGRRPCRPAAIRGEIVAAKARAVYAAKRGGTAYTGSIAGKTAADTIPHAVPGEDGLPDDEGDDTVTGSISAPVAAAVPGADGEFDEDDVTGSIGTQTGWPRLAPLSARKAPVVQEDRLTRF